MGFIKFDLTNTGSLTTLASSGAGMTGILPPGIPGAGGLYVIFNSKRNNRYVGKSQNLQSRFNGRMTTVNEFGFTPEDLECLGVFWGAATSFNTPATQYNIKSDYPYDPNAHFQIVSRGDGTIPAGKLPNVLESVPCAQINYNDNQQVTSIIDRTTVNIEAALIRFFAHAAGTGGTITNRTYLRSFTNPLNRELIILVEWGRCDEVNIAAGYACILIPAGVTM